jgi:hypothetical protein
MDQKQYNELDNDLRTEKRRFTNAVLRKAKAAGLNPKNLVHRLAIRKLAEVDYEMVMALLVEDGK